MYREILSLLVTKLKIRPEKEAESQALLLNHPKNSGKKKMEQQMEIRTSLPNIMSVFLAHRKTHCKEVI